MYLSGYPGNTTSEPPISMAARSSLSDFAVLGRLGSGSYGTVFKVRRKQDGQIYVAKAIRIAEMEVRRKPPPTGCSSAAKAHRTPAPRPPNARRTPQRSDAAAPQRPLRSVTNNQHWINHLKPSGL